MKREKRGEEGKGEKKRGELPANGYSVRVVVARYYIDTYSILLSARDNENSMMCRQAGDNSLLEPLLRAENFRSYQLFMGE